MSSRATNGKVMKTVARTIPGTAKMICRSCCASLAPNHPCAPKSSTKIRPDTTGDTEKGKSMKVMSRLLPGKSNLAIAQDAARPKSTLSGTLMAATRRVSLTAANARSEEHTYELQSLMRISYAVFCLKKKRKQDG